MERKKRLPEIKRGNPLLPGVIYQNGGYNFAVDLPWKEEGSLLLYRKGSVRPAHEIPLENRFRTGDTAAVWIREQDAEQYEYNYRIGGKVVHDPCARALTGREQFGREETKEREHQVRGRIFRIDPGEEESVFIPYEEAVFYKVHVRGYTKKKTSGVNCRGTFAGLKEKIPYLKALGVTSLELMPAYEFQELPPFEPESGPYQQSEKSPGRLNYWGYTGGFYFAPKSAYSGGDPTAEFQDLVRALHAEGMECIMEFFFVKGTGGQRILEVLRWWKMIYHVDGFHILGEDIPQKLIAQEPVFSKTKLIFTGVDDWGIYGGAKPSLRNLAEYNMGFQNTARRFLKGDEDQVSEFCRESRRNPETHGVIRYMASQDGFTLQDLVSYDYRHNEGNGEDNRDGCSYNFSWNCGTEGASRKQAVQELRRRQVRNAVLMVVLSQGTPLFYGGDEFGNSQGGNNNAYCQDNAIGWTDWNQAEKNKELTEFIRDALVFRKEHKILHGREELRLMDYESRGCPDLSYHSDRAWYAQMENTSRQIGMMYNRIYEDPARKEMIYVAYNMHWNSHAFALPILEEGMCWYEVADTGKKEGFRKSGEEIKREEDRFITAEPRTILVLIGRQEETV